MKFQWNADTILKGFDGIIDLSDSSVTKMMKAIEDSKENNPVSSILNEAFENAKKLIQEGQEEKAVQSFSERMTEYVDGLMALAKEGLPDDNACCEPPSQDLSPEPEMRRMKLFFSKEDIAQRIGIPVNQFVITEVISQPSQTELEIVLDSNAPEPKAPLEATPVKQGEDLRRQRFLDVNNPSPMNITVNLTEGLEGKSTKEVLDKIAEATAWATKSAENLPDGLHLTQNFPIAECSSCDFFKNATESEKTPEDFAHLIGKKITEISNKRLILSDEFTKKKLPIYAKFGVHRSDMQLLHHYYTKAIEALEEAEFHTSNVEVFEESIKDHPDADFLFRKES